MEINAYHNLLERFITTLPTLSERLVVVPAQAFVAELDMRITQEGLDTNGAKIGNYSTTKTWAGKDAFTNPSSNFKPQKLKNGKTRKTVTLEEGYLELRRIEGYRVDKVVLERTGAGIKNIKVGAPIETADGASVEVGFTDPDEAIKFRGYEEKRDKTILSPSAEELASVKKAQIEELRLFIAEIFNPNAATA